MSRQKRTAASGAVQEASATSNGGGATGLLPVAGAIQDDSATRLQAFTQYRDHVWGLRQSNIEHLDNLVLTLSAGILGISITFIKDIVPLGRSIHFWWLIASWSLLAVTILATLASYWTGRFQIEVQITYAKEYYLNGDETYLRKRNPWKLAAEMCGLAASGCFTLGVIVLLAFVSTNLLKERAYQTRHPQSVVLGPTQTTVLTIGHSSGEAK